MSAAQTRDEVIAAPEPIARNCLCCGDPFWAETRFIRLCPPCKVDGESRRSTRALRNGGRPHPATSQDPSAER
jgi:hypothetical protein